MKTAILIAAAALAPAMAVAHPGHDHSAASSDLVHAMFYAAPVIAAAIGLAVIRLRNSK